MLLQGGVPESYYARPDRVLDWVDLGVHPKIAAQPADSAGSRVTSFFPYGETMLIGYGDYGLNTGPIAVCGYDMLDLTPVVLFENAPTEALYRFRKIDGHLYTPWVDPEWYYGPGGYTTDASGSWENVEVGDMVHTFDMTKFADKLVVSGSTLVDGGARDTASACVWTQVDGEWVRTFEGPETSRAYRMIEEGGKLWVAWRTDSGNVGPPFSTTDGITWTQQTTGPKGLHSDWGDLEVRQKAFPVPDPNTVVTSRIANSRIWVARMNGHVEVASLLDPDVT